MELTRKTKGMSIPKLTVKEIEQNMSNKDAKLIYDLDHRKISEEDKSWSAESTGKFMQKKKQFIMRFIKIVAPFLSVFLLSLVFSTHVKADDDDPFDITNPWGFTNPISPNNPNSPTNPMNWDDDDEESNDTSTEDNINNELPSETHAREKREEKQNQKELDEAMNSPINMFAFFGLILICLIILTWIFI